MAVAFYIAPWSMLCFLIGLDNVDLVPLDNLCDVGQHSQTHDVNITTD